MGVKGSPSCDHPSICQKCIFIDLFLLWGNALEGQRPLIPFNHTCMGNSLSKEDTFCVQDPLSGSVVYIRWLLYEGVYI